MGIVVSEIENGGARSSSARFNVRSSVGPITLPWIERSSSQPDSKAISWCELSDLMRTMRQLLQLNSHLGPQINFRDMKSLIVDRRASPFHYQTWRRGKKTYYARMFRANFGLDRLFLTDVVFACLNFFLLKIFRWARDLVDTNHERAGMCERRCKRPTHEWHTNISK